MRCVRVVVEEGEEPLQRPLLQRQGAGEAADTPLQPAPRGGTCSTAGGVANLVTTAVGAGMVALPRAVSETGIVLGMMLFFGTAALTLGSTSIIVRCEPLLLWERGRAGCAPDRQPTRVVCCFAGLQAKGTGLAGGERPRLRCCHSLRCTLLALLP